MPFLTVSGITVPVSVDGQTTETREVIGSQQRTFDGSMRSGIRRRPRIYDFRTPAMQVASATSLVGALTAPPPIPVSGSVFFDPAGAIQAHLLGLAAEFVRIGADEAIVLRFQLAEA